MINQVRIGSQILHGEDRFGQWVTENIAGWDDSPGVKGDGTAKDLGDGDYDLEARLSARIPVLTVVLVGLNRSSALAGLQAVKAAARISGAHLVVTDADLTQNAWVKRTGFDATWITKNAVRFQLSLKAPDPCKYGEVRFFTATTSENVVVYHYGDYWATPKFTVKGSMPGGYSLTLAGRTYNVSAPLTASAPHTIDYRDGRLRVGGSLVTGGVSSASIYRVEPGQLDTLSLSPRTSGSGSVVMELADTYV